MLVRYAITITEYNYNIEFLGGKTMLTLSPSCPVIPLCRCSLHLHCNVSQRHQHSKEHRHSLYTQATGARVFIRVLWLEQSHNDVRFGAPTVPLKFIRFQHSLCARITIASTALSFNRCYLKWTKSTKKLHLSLNTDTVINLH